MRFVYILFCLLFSIGNSFAQSGEGSAADGNLNRGCELYLANKPDSAIIYFKLALIPDRPEPASGQDGITRDSYNFLAHAYEALGQLDSALVYGRKLIAHAAAMGDSTYVAAGRSHVAGILNNTGRKDEALEYYLQAAGLAETIGNYLLATVCYNGASLINTYADRAETGLQLAGSAIRCAEKSGNGSALGTALNVKAAAYYRMEMYTHAMDSYRKAMAAYEEAGDRQNYDITRSSLTHVLSKAGEYDEAYANVISSEGRFEVGSGYDSLTLPDSYGDMKLRMLMYNSNANDKQMKFDILQREHLERQARNLRLRVWLVSALAVLAVVALLLLYNRQRQKARAEAAARYAQEKENEFLSFQKEAEMQMIRKYIDGLESERSRISRELHDGICNDLLAVEMQLKSSGKDIGPQAALLQNARENIRSVSHELMPPAFQYASIDEILSDYIARLNVPQGVGVRYVQSGDADWSIVPQKTALEIYRITQEAVGNSVKHAHADEIEVSLAAGDGAVVLEIRDNGTGIDRTAGTRGAGLQMIRERVGSVGGVLHIDSGAAGTVVRARFGLTE